MPVQGKRQIGSDGKRFITTAGKTSTDSDTSGDCCCPGSDTGCGTCGAIADLVMTFSGIVKCTCAFNGTIGWCTLITDPNGVYTGFTADTPPTGYDCFFYKNLALLLHAYSTPDCSDSPSDFFDGVVSAIHEISTNKWHVSIGSGPLIIDVHYFDGQVVAGFDEGPLSMSSSVATCPTDSGNETLAHSGAVILDFVCG